MSLCYYNFKNIFDFLPTKDLSNIKSVSKELFNYFSDYIYFRSSSDRIQLISLDYLIEENFWPIINQLSQNVISVIKKILSNKYFCIAGGFTTQCYLGQTPKNTSDIDIYVLGGLSAFDAQIEYFKLVKWLKDTKQFTFTEYVIGYSNCIYTIRIDNFPFDLQFIFSNYHTITEVFTSFDNSHNRCGMYLDKCYISPDAKISKETMITYFYINSSTKRYKKATNLGFYIYTLSKEQNEKLNDTNYIFKNPEINIVINSWENIRFIKKWYNDYYHFDSEFNKPIEINILHDYDNIKNNLEIGFDNKDNLCINYIKPSNIPFLTIKRVAKLYLKISAINENDKKKIIIVGDYNKLLKIKNILLDITRRAHHIYKVPQHILETTKDLVGFQQFKKVCVDKKNYLLETINYLNKDTYSISTKNKIKDFKEDVVNLTEENIDIFYKSFLYSGYDNLYLYLGYEYRDFITLNSIKGTGILKPYNCNYKINKNKDNISNQKLEFIGSKKPIHYDKRNYGNFGYWSYIIYN